MHAAGERVGEDVQVAGVIYKLNLWPRRKVRGIECGKGLLLWTLAEEACRCFVRVAQEGAARRQGQSEGGVAGECDGEGTGGESAWRRGRSSLYSQRNKTQDERRPIIMRSLSPSPGHIAVRLPINSTSHSDKLLFSIPRFPRLFLALPTDSLIGHTLPPRHRLVVPLLFDSNLSLTTLSSLPTTGSSSRDPRTHTSHSARNSALLRQIRSHAHLP